RRAHDRPRDADDHARRAHDRPRDPDAPARRARDRPRDADDPARRARDRPRGADDPARRGGTGTGAALVLVTIYRPRLRPLVAAPVDFSLGDAESAAGPRRSP